MKNKGILPINKPQGWTSFDVCNKLKYMVKPLKIGHLGTLDPMATGVLLVTIGKATKLFDIMQAKEKTYIAEFEFGYETDTLDSTGERINTASYLPTRLEIEQEITKFIGNISQVPPKYSAKNVNGKRAYELARENKEFELKPKQVEIHNIDLLSYNNNILKLQITCGSGTYIRSIGRDLASNLNSYATMVSLVRTAVGKFKVENCQNIQSLDPGNIADAIVDLDEVLDYNKLIVDDQTILKLLNGQIVPLNKPNGRYYLLNNNEIVAIVNICENLAKMSIFLG